MKRYLILISTVFLILGCKAEDELSIGSIQQLTGQMSKYGQTHVAAVSAMLEIINAERESKDLPQITLIVDDDKLQPAEGTKIIQRMISVYNVTAVLGAQGSSVTLAMAPVAEKNKVVLMSGASGSPKISDAGDYIFRTCPSDVYEAEYTAKVYDQLYGDKSVAIIYINNDYGLGLKNAFISSIESKPSSILELAFAQGANDFKNQIAQIKEKNIEVVYIIGYEEMITIFKQAKEFGLQCSWLGNNQLNDQSMIEKMGTTADGTIFPGHQFELEEVKKKYADFYSNYLKLSKGEELDVFAAYGADAIMVINHVMLQGAETGEEIKNSLYKVKDFEGVTGAFSFNENGDAIRTLSLYQIQEGKIVPYNF
jgi:branched-chain amino acid transport system substrate-binding protein